MVKPDHAFLNHIVSLCLATGEICKRVEVGASLSGAAELDMKVAKHRLNVLLVDPLSMT